MQAQPLTLSRHWSLWMQATEDEIKQQFRKLALRHHPDKAGNAERFQQIRDAFEVLKDPAARCKYDKTLLHQFDMQVCACVVACGCVCVCMP